MSDATETRLEELLGEMRKANRILEDSKDGKNKDGGRKAAAMDGQAAIAKQLVANDEKREDKARKAAKKAKLSATIDELKELMAQSRKPSKAGSIGMGPASRDGSSSRVRNQGGVKPFRALKASFSDYKAGEWLTALLDVHGIGATSALDIDRIAVGKAAMAQFAAFGTLPGVPGGYHLVDGDGKATLGSTGATGGYVLPNNLVDTVVKPAVQKAVYQQLVTVVGGVAVRGVDQPYRLGKPPRATFQDWGTTKENLNEAYGSYTATLGTLARVYDISKQYARFSSGSAEQDVMDELTKAMILGENYYIIAGAGTGSVGTGDPTTGVYTALAASASFNGYTTAFSPVATTLLGSAAEAFTTASAALASRNRDAEAIVVDATSFWTIIGQGTDTAGFWVSPAGGPTGFTRTASGGISFWNIPMYYDSNLGTAATTKIALLGEWSALKLYRGMEFRIDTSDVAGTRWDQNLIGFRGEEEIGFNAYTAVNIGAMQLITGVIA